MATTVINTRCCVVGGGPAGMMLGFLLARAGIDVVVLEKHADFLRDFRGDTIHPSTLELMHELRLLADFLKLPHQEVSTLSVRIGTQASPVADFRHLSTTCRFVALMPQWDFLNFLADRGRRYAAFHLAMSAEAQELIEENGAIVGVRAQAPTGPLEVRALLTVGCDGRHSTVRERAGLKVEDLGAPMDVLWFRLARRPQDPENTELVFLPGHIFISINRGDYWQCAYVIPKGAAEVVRAQGLAQFQRNVAKAAPLFGDRVQTLSDWDTVKLLTVSVDRLRQWYRPGLLCIGDAAHAMSPVGGVGVNLAVQDAVATANILCQSLRAGRVAESTLRRIQHRRQFAAKLTQRGQIFIQNRIVAGVLGGTKELSEPLPFKLLRAIPFLRRIPARLIGIGVRPEHIETPDVMAG